MLARSDPSSQLVSNRSQLALNRHSDNVDPCQALLERTTVYTQRRAPFRSR